MIDAILGTAFMLSLAAFVWWKTSLFSELRAALARQRLLFRDRSSVDRADMLLEEAKRICGEDLANRKAIAEFCRDCPPDQADVVLRTMDLIHAMRAALARKAAELGIGDPSVIEPAPIEQMAPVVRLPAANERPRVTWRDGRPVPR